MRTRPKTTRPRIDPATLHLLVQLGWGLLTVTIVGCVVAAIWYVSRAPIFTIANVVAEGGVTISPAEVIRRAEPALEGTYLGLIPRRFSYLYPEEDIVNVVNDVPRIKDVSLARVDRRTLAIRYDEYVPHALWCNNRDSHHCFFIDEGGYAFGEAPDLRGGSLLRYYTPETEPVVGPVPFSLEAYRQTEAFVRDLALSGWFVAGVEIDSVGDAFYTLVGGGELKTSLATGNEKPLEYLNTIRTSDEFSHLTPDNFLYIDLRFGTKLFVKERDETLEEVATSSEVVVDEHNQ